MELTFLTGSSGCGKSKQLYDILLKLSADYPEKRLFLVVPEQFTMQAQRNIVEQSPGHGTFSIDIVSFNRLAYRVFEELGIRLPTAIDDTGKNLILRKVMDENRNKLFLIRPKDTQGFISEIKSVISELLQYSVTYDMLSGVCDRIKDGGINSNERLRRKLQDIMVIYRGFREYIAEKYIAMEEILEILCGCIERSQIVKDSIIAFDGFTGFTPVQYRLIELLFRKAEQMYFTVTIPKEADKQLFGMSFDMIKRLKDCAGRNGVTVHSTVVGEEVPYRFAQTPSLAHLEKNLFREEKEYDGPVPNITVYSALGKKAEVSYTAAEIKRLVAQGYRYRQIGVIVGDMEEYKELIFDIFRENRIPVFMDSKRSILTNPAVEYIRSALEVIQKDYSYEAVFRLLKGHMCPLERETVDVLENYVLALGIRGHKRWNEKFSRRYPSKRGIDMELVNAAREGAVRLLEPLWSVSHDKDRCIRDYIAALNDFLEASQVYEKLDDLKEEMQTEGKAALAKEYGQSYGDIIRLFEQTAVLLGDEKMNIRQFSDVLDAGFGEIKLGIIPPTIDMVMVGDVERTRLDHVRALFFVGVNEGLVPKINSNKGLFSEAEREILSAANLELSPTCRKKAYMQNFYLYLVLTKPSDRIVFTFNREGRPSKLLADIIRMFPGAAVRSDEAGTSMNLIYNGREGMQYLFEKMGERQELTKEEKALFAVLSADSQLGRKMEELADTALRSVTEERITKEAAKLLYGEILKGSVSRMETYASCAFAHFAKYGLDLEERHFYELGAADLGTLFHEALKEYSVRISKEGQNFGTVDKELRKRYIKEAVEYAMTDYNNSVFYDSSRNEYMRGKILAMLERTVWALGEQIKAGSFAPGKFEHDFVFRENGMEIHGTIDRIDYALREDKSYVKIIDYKSGRKTLDFGKLYDGLQLQLMIYMESLLKENIPAAAMYYNIDNPIVDYEEGMDGNAAVLRALRPQGIVNAGIDAIELLDNVTKQGQSDYLPIAYNKDGSLSKTSQATTEERFRILGAYAAKKMANLGQEIEAGSTAPNPYPDSCTYCPYGTVCGFYAKEKGASCRRPSKLKNDDESFQLFSKEVNR